LRRFILACGLLLAFAGMATAAAAATASSNTETNPITISSATTTVATTVSQDAPSPWEVRKAAIFRRHIQRFRADARHWTTVMRGRPSAGVPRLLSARTPSARSLGTLRRLERRWRHLAHGARWHATHPPNLRTWLCIHHFEGSWADSGGPYWGGLQMDLSFQRTYGGWLLRHKGTADHWSPLEQIWVAVRASHSRGFSPWPNTARDCGLY
jgi:hypothetical protein